jgi:hypothetical protein
MVYWTIMLVSSSGLAIENLPRMWANFTHCGYIQSVTDINKRSDIERNHTWKSTINSLHHP